MATASESLVRATVNLPGLRCGHFAIVAAAEPQIVELLKAGMLVPERYANETEDAPSGER